MKLLRSCVILLATVALCAAHAGGGLTMQDLGAHVYCGRNLAITISELCLIYQRPEKRSEATLYGAGIPSYYKYQEYGWPWVPVHKAQSLSLPSRGKRLLIYGLTDECCVKECSMDEMLNYCD